MPDYPARRPYDPDPADEPPYGGRGQRAQAPERKYYEQYENPPANHENAWPEPAQERSPWDEPDTYRDRGEYGLPNRLDRQAHEEFPDRPARGLGSRRNRPDEAAPMRGPVGRRDESGLHDDAGWNEQRPRFGGARPESSGRAAWSARGGQQPGGYEPDRESGRSRQEPGRNGRGTRDASAWGGRGAHGNGASGLRGRQQDPRTDAYDEYDSEPADPQPRPRTRYRDRALGPLTAASGMIKAIVAPRRVEPDDATNPSGLPPVEAKDLNPPARRPSFFDMESEAPDPGRTSDEPERIPSNAANFPSLGGSRSGPPPRVQSFRTPKRRGPRLPLIAAVMVVLMIVCGVAYAIGTGGDEKSSTDTAVVPEDAATPSSAATASGEAEESEKPATTGAAKKVGVGVYRGTYPSKVGEFGDWLGRDAAYAMDYSTRGTWEEIAAPTYMLNTWQNSGYQMVYAVAMLPTRNKSVSLAAGADGDYNQHFERLAKNLVAYDQGDAILRLGWEFNVDWPWHPTLGDEKDFIKFWRNIVTTMRSVPGAENLKFDWNVNNGGDSYNSTLFYPGNKYVDYIGVDVYDISWAENTYPFPAGCEADCQRAHQEQAWTNVVSATYGLSFWSSFAQEKKKPMSLPEWGMWDRSISDGHGGGDNPYFVEQMFKFVDDPRNNVAYQIYFDVNVGEKGDHRLESLPKGGKKFKKLFGK
ncbi:hypothetical protein LWF15_10310 [Kineosporia rhizophila]|uniref:glycosyl hydrolase n=1 Tax=Kineosporia rhizophila TaxID=84633 RepID=UPI001E64E47A|nr:glycosyl hydrolase [Kineosporia rhizophila]MCE0535905.1 hypothetical protein [Kineosporia rhizophila]